MQHSSAPVSLPPLEGVTFEGDEISLRAYARLLPLESQNPLWIRILGQMLLQAPSPSGRTYVAESIIDCSTTQQIFQLGDLHLNQFIRYFKYKSRPSHTPWMHPSQPSFRGIQQMISSSLVESSANHGDAKTSALVRDNYRCMLSGNFDWRSVRSIPGLADEVLRMPVPSAKDTECSHILPQYITHGLTEATRRRDAATVWTIGFLFGNLPDHELNGSGIHDLRNIMTLETSIHQSFDDLRLWLEPIEGVENKYMIRRSKGFVHPYLPATVTFSSSSPDLPLPDPRYLAYHAACARIVNLTGAAEYAERVIRDHEDVKVLSKDGSSANLLSHLLPMDMLTAF